MFHILIVVVKRFYLYMKLKWVKNLWEMSEQNIRLLGTSESIRLAVDWDDTIGVFSSYYNDEDLQNPGLPDLICAEKERTVFLAPGIIDTILQAKQNNGAKIGIFTKNQRALMEKYWAGEMVCFGNDLKTSFSCAERLVTYTRDGEQVIVKSRDKIVEYIHRELLQHLDFIICKESYVDTEPFNFVSDKDDERHSIKDLKLLGGYGNKTIVFDDQFDGAHSNLLLPNGYEQWKQGCYITSTFLSDVFKSLNPVTDDTLDVFYNEQNEVLNRIRCM